MKCKHREHYAKHAYVFVPTRLSDSDMLDFAGGALHVRSECVCLACDEVIPLGPSNDAGVEYEIRAAEIAAGLADGGCEVSCIEQSGFNGEPVKARGGIVVKLETPSVWAGRLAHVIIAHEDLNG